MSDLRFVGSDGDRLELTDETGATHTLKVDDALKKAVTESTAERRLFSVAPEGPAFSIKEIQARLRAGESFAEVSRISGLPTSKIERYASPIMQERAWIIEQAEKSSPKGSPIPLRELVVNRLAPRGVNMNQISWNTWRLDNGAWNLVLNFPSSDGAREAIWIFDLNKRTFSSQNDDARWIFGEEPPKQKQERISNHEVLFPLEGDVPPPPRLVAVRSDPKADMSLDNQTDQLSEKEQIPADAKKDGVTRRISIPSWDDIMFGRSKKKEEGEES